MNILILRCQRSFSNFGPFKIWNSSLWKEYWTKISSIPPPHALTTLHYMMPLDRVHICKQLTEHKSQTRQRQTCCFMWEYCQVKNMLCQSEAMEGHQLSLIGTLIYVLCFIEFVLKNVMVSAGTWVMMCCRLSIYLVQAIYFCKIHEPASAQKSLWEDTITKQNTLLE